MNKFEKYVGKVKFNCGGEDLELIFLVEDRIALAGIYDIKDYEGRYKKLVDICTRILQRSYPEEKPEHIASFLTRNIDEFYTKLLVASGITTEKAIEELREGLKKTELL